MIAGLTLFSACKKDAGAGGTSSITGTVSGRIYSNSNGSDAEAEVTQITIPDGAVIEDGDYVLLNTPAGGGAYYIWFHWSSGVAPDPGLIGRTSIQVTYDFTETNVEVAANVLAALVANASADFTFSINNDVVSLTNKVLGEVTDADEISSSILVDISNQGKSSVSGGSSYVEGAMVEERVYLIYGDDDFYSETVRTDENGNYQFKDLNRGDYRVYTFTDDTLNPMGMKKRVEVSAVIDDKKQIVQAPSLFVVKL
ncbi:MAG: hypothetical protein A3D92_23435 [Bacteroidetes bacterium RIFCSPHIGHO2_02_FULL_44_7]|nr:MAG: hypothetical protein A3D92_23435 [Bacteroidetes bacterium RIFCSPHIGHO2_02_FULL_44_7]